jgi:hypothetical protein
MAYVPYRIGLLATKDIHIMHIDVGPESTFLAIAP